VSVRPRHEVTMEQRTKYEVFRAGMRRRRHDLGLTQVDVAERMGRSQDFVAVLENNASVPNLLTVFLWVQALDGDISPGVFFRGEG
jgi:transcriptional regulator with XRE-family HTH domain